MSDQFPVSGASGDDLPPAIRDLLRQLTGSDEIDPQMAKMLADSGIGDVDPGMLQAAMQQVQQMFEAPDDEAGSINATMATDVARKTVSAAGDTVVSDADRRAVEQAVRIAGLWLDEVTAFEAPSAQARAWSRAEWVEATMPRWRTLVEPVADGVSAAIGQAMTAQIAEMGEGGLPEGMVPPGTNPAAMMAQMQPMLARMSGSMFSLQTGQAVGALAAEVLTGTDMGLPLVAPHDLALLPANADAFAEGLEIDRDQVLIYLAVREGARMRLFEDVAWLGPQLVRAVQDYGRDIRIDSEAIEANLSQVNPGDPEAMQKALQDNLFKPEPSASQRATLARLETYLALVEGWVDLVTDRATSNHLPQAQALGEMVRRRRATGGPAEKIFSGLVGLELRPRRLRDAANLFAAVEDKHGSSLRDAVWAHPDLAPTAADLDDPLGFVEKVAERGAGGDELDAELDRILSGADADGPGATGDDGPGDAGDAAPDDRA
ncbi:zinc-dependent metalloprotease [Actinomycetota bacterium]